MLAVTSCRGWFRYLCSVSKYQHVCNLNVEEGDLVGFESWVGFQRFLQGFYGVVSVGYDFAFVECYVFSSEFLVFLWAYVWSLIHVFGHD